MCELKILNFFLSLYFLWMKSSTSSGDWRPLKFCSVFNFGDLNPSHNFCNKLEENGTNITCTRAVDRSHCLEKLLNNDADFGVFKSEDLLLATSLDNLSDKALVITNEFKLSPTQNYEFDLVVLVKNNEPIHSFDDLRGKSLCHPGFDENGRMYDFSEIFLQYFEEIVVPEQCDSNLTVLENKIKSVSSFFGDSCKPGPWSPEILIDKRLKDRYKSLCNQCSYQNTCSRRDLYWGQQGALRCLFDCRGDIAWARLADIEVQSTFQYPLECYDVSFLCPDGSLQPKNTSSPCIWLSRPWPVIVSRRSVQADVSTLVDYLNNSPNTYVMNTWEYVMRYLLNRSFQKVYSVGPISPKEYLEKVPGYVHANSMKTCSGTGEDKVIKICVQSESAQKKCQLLGKVADVYSIDPKFDCVMADDCFQNVIDHQQDVYITNTDNLKTVFEKDKLKIILYQTTEDYAELRYSSAVVAAESTIQSLADLKGKKACFTRYNGVGWNSFLIALKENSLIDDFCNGTKVMLEFFSEICIINPGRETEIRGCFEVDDPVWPFEGFDMDESQGLRCLAYGGGDVTFIDHNFIKKYLDEYNWEQWDSKLKESDFRTICPNKNSNVVDCHLSIAAFGEVLVNRNISQDREEEIVSAFLLLSSLFGEKSHSDADAKTLRLFSHYRNENNVLFESSASRLETAQIYKQKGRFADNIYEGKLAEMVITCSHLSRIAKNSSHSVMISNFTVISLISLLALMFPYSI